MKYSIFIKGRAWSFALAHSLNKRNKLNFLTTSYPKFVTKKYNLPKNKIKSVIIIELFVRGLRQINKYLNKIRLNIHPALILDWVTDFIYSYFYINNSDYYIIGFGGSFCKLIKKAKKNNIKTIYFLNNSSPSFREKIKKEYRQLGLLSHYNKEEITITRKINQNIQDADYIGCISSFQRKTYVDEGILDDKKAFTTIMGVDTQIFYKKKIMNNKFIVIAVGNEFVRKGFKYLIEGFNNLKLSNSELWIICGDNINLIKKISKLEKNNLIIKPVSEFELPNLYNQASVFCLPTLEEGAPAVITQAMACGLPVILTRNCQGPDIINNSQNGFIIDDRDSSIISEKIKFFYDNPKKRIEMGNSCAIYAKEKLSYDAMTLNITKFVEDKNE